MFAKNYSAQLFYEIPEPFLKMKPYICELFLNIYGAESHRQGREIVLRDGLLILLF